MAIVPHARTRALDTAPFRFFAKVKLDPSSGCWVWMGARVRGGYGKFFSHKERLTDGRRRTVLVPAHRWSYEFHVAPIPEGREIDHLCRNKSCVNPAHLEVVTHVENCRRVPRPPTCPSGHEFTEENTAYVDSDGYQTRVCRECRRASNRATTLRRRAERRAS